MVVEKRYVRGVYNPLKKAGRLIEILYIGHAEIRSSAAAVKGVAQAAPFLR